MLRISVVAILCVLLSASGANAGILLKGRRFHETSKLGRFIQNFVLKGQRQCGRITRHVDDCRIMSCNAFCDECQDPCCQDESESICEYCDEVIPPGSECECLAGNDLAGGGGVGGGVGSSAGGGGGFGAAGLFGFGGSGASGFSGVGGSAVSALGGGFNAPGIGGGSVTGFSGFTGGGGGFNAPGIGGVSVTGFSGFTGGGGGFNAPAIGGGSVTGFSGFTGGGGGFNAPAIGGGSVTGFSGFTGGGGSEGEFNRFGRSGVVPEPSSFLIYSLTSTGIFLVRRRRR